MPRNSAETPLPVCRRPTASVASFVRQASWGGGDKSRCLAQVSHNAGGGGVGVSSPSRPVSCLVRWLPCLQGVWSPLWCCREVVTKAGLTRRLGNHDHSHGSASKSGRRAKALPDIVPLPTRRPACSDIREPPTATVRQTDYPRIRQDNYSEAEQSLSVLLPTPPGETRHRNAADGQAHTHKACTKPKVPRRRAGCIAFSPPPTNIGGT